MIVRDEDGCLDPGFLELGDLGRVRHVRGVVQLHPGAVGFFELVDDAGSGDHQIEVELARQALLDDFEMEKSQETAAEAEA